MDFPYGEIIKYLPEDFAPPEIWPECGFIAGPPKICSRESVGTNPKGIRWSCWPLTFEQYSSDTEPDLVASGYGSLARNREVIWFRISRNDIPSGWKQRSNTPAQVDGFRSLMGDVTSNWHKNARRDLRIWREQFANKTHHIVRITLDEFRDSYKTSLIGTRLGMQRYDELKLRIELPRGRENVDLWGVRNLQTGAIVGGIAVINSPTFKSSTHMAPFIHEEGRGIFAATALNYHWFIDSQKRGHRYAVSTNFWFPGKPDSWKGFSEFKSHFGWQYVAYPPELTRFVRGKLF